MPGGSQMPPDLVARWAALNGLTVAPEPFGLHQLADAPPAGADTVPTPNAESATFLVDATGRPSAIVFISYGGHWLRELADLVHWLKLSAFAPPAPREDGDKHFIIVMRSGAAEPHWLPEQR